MPRVYIGRLSYQARERDVERFFKGYGKILEVDLKNGWGGLKRGLSCGDGAGGRGDGRGTPAPLGAATGHLRLRHSSGASGARVGPSSYCACAGGGGGGIIGAMVSRWVGRGGGGTRVGLGLRAGGHTAPGRPGFFLLGPWDWGLVRLQWRPTFPALRAAGNRFPASFSPLTQFTGSDGHSASLPGTGALKGPAPPPPPSFF